VDSFFVRPQLSDQPDFPIVGSNGETIENVNTNKKAADILNVNFRVASVITLAAAAFISNSKK
jgi:hypothetical protein